jgi:uncharacterized membrane protein
MSDQNQIHTAKHDQSIALKIAAAAIFAALVAVTTLTFAIPIPATTGYFNLGETLIYVAALLLGPAVGAFAGGGASIADMLVAPQFFLGTLPIKALEGFIVGFLYKKLFRITKSVTISATVAILIGGLEMVIGYLLYEALALGYGFAAFVEVPFNLIQMAVGLVIAVPVTVGVMRIFPQLRSYLQ